MARERLLRLSCPRNLKMFFDNIKDIPDIAKKNGSSIFIVPDSVDVEIKNSLVLKPEEKTIISIGQIHNMLESFNLKRADDQFVIIRPADKIGNDASGALLKSLEEPSLNLHFVLITENLTKILPTIRSRSAIYFLKENWSERSSINADEKTILLAKRLIGASGGDLVDIANEIYATKQNKIEFAEKVVGVAIEMLYKTYFITEKQIFVRKIPKFLNLYDNLSKNGNIKLHIVADLC